jgi:hypothetical protein
MRNLTAAEFGILIAKALLHIQSSNAWFIFQQAVQDIPDNEDMEYGSTEDWLRTLIAKTVEAQGEADRHISESVLHYLEEVYEDSDLNEIAGRIIALFRPAEDWLRTRAEQKAADSLMSDDEYELRKFIALAHQDGKCQIYGDDGELQCSNMIRHGRTIDFRREPIRALLEVIYATRLKEYAALARGKP